MAILDQHGNPISSSDLETPQTERDESRVSSMHTEFATHPSRGLTPSKLASILQDAEHGDLVGQADLAEDIEEKSAHVHAELSKRKRALLGLDWNIIPPRNATAAEKNAAEQVKEMIEDLDDFDDYLFDIADAINKGYSCLEYDWQRDGKDWTFTLTHQPARWFTVARNDRNDLRLRSNTPDGDSLQPFGWIKHVHKAKSGYVTRAGLARVLAWPYLFKNYSVRDLAEFLEIYGLPTRVGTYPAGSGDKEKSTLLRAVVGIGHDAAGIIPEGMAIDFKEAAKGTHMPFMAMIDWCEGSESKAILGGTLTSTAASTGLGSNLGDVHNEVRHDLLVSDAAQIGGTLTRDMVYPLMALNISGIDQTRTWRFEFDTKQPDDRKVRADTDKKIFDMGYRPTPDYIQEHYGDGFELIPPAGSTVITATTTAAAKAHAGEGDRDVSDNYSDRLDDEAGPLFDSLMQPVRDLVVNADSLEEIRDGLIELYPDMDASDLGALIQRALTSADLAGRYEIAEGVEES